MAECGSSLASVLPLSMILVFVVGFPRNIILPWLCSYLHLGSYFSLNFSEKYVVGIAGSRIVADVLSSICIKDIVVQCDPAPDGATILSRFITFIRQVLFGCGSTAFSCVLYQWVRWIQRKRLGNPEESLLRFAYEFFDGSIFRLVFTVLFLYAFCHLATAVYSAAFVMLLEWVVIGVLASGTMLCYFILVAWYLGVHYVNLLWVFISNHVHGEDLLTALFFLSLFVVSLFLARRMISVLRMMRNRLASRPSARSPLLG